MYQVSDNANVRALQSFESAPLPLRHSWPEYPERRRIPVQIRRPSHRTDLPVAEEPAHRRRAYLVAEDAAVVTRLAVEAAPAPRA